MAAQQGLPGEFEVYYGEERMVITLDIGNINSSIAIAHLQFGKVPAVRSVTRYPGGLTSSRTPSALAYDLKDRPRAYGAEASLPDVVARGKDEGWVIVTKFKSQMLPVPSLEGKKPKNKLSKQPKPDRTSKGSSLVPGLHLPFSNSSLSVNSIPGTTSSGYPLLARSLTPDQLVDATSVVPDPPDSDWIIEPPPTPGGKKMTAFQGPVLKLIYSDHMKHLVACARAWFGETTPNGDETFMRLWTTCTFVIPHPADWGPAETDMLREGMQLAKLIPSELEYLRDRLIFLKEPAAIVYFARRHVGPGGADWVRSQAPFVLCDSSEVATSIIGYRIAALDPLIKLQPYDPLSRLSVGAGSVTGAFHAFATKRLSKTKFKGAEFVSALMEQFEQRIKTKFASVDEIFNLRVAAEGSDSHGATIKDGLLVVSGIDIEDVFLPTITAIISRLSAVVSLGEAKSIVLAGGFGENPYLQRRLRETFEPRGVLVVIPEIPTYNAVSEGAARFYLTDSIRPRPTRFDLGVSSAVDWSSNWEKGMDREIFTSVSGKRFILGKWTAVVPKGTLLDPPVPITKVYHVKFVLATGNFTFQVDLWAHDTDSEPKAEGWMTSLEGAPLPNFLPVCSVEADLTSLVASLPVRGQRSGEDESKWWVQADLELVVFVGEESLEACVRWVENGAEMRGPTSRIPDEFF